MPTLVKKLITNLDFSSTPGSDCTTEVPLIIDIDLTVNLAFVMFLYNR